LRNISHLCMFIPTWTLLCYFHKYILFRCVPGLAIQFGQ
jgi:hypothetical protein